MNGGCGSGLGELLKELAVPSLPLEPGSRLCERSGAGREAGRRALSVVLTGAKSSGSPYAQTCSCALRPVSALQKGSQGVKADTLHRVGEVEVHFTCLYKVKKKV
ncbi:hypothetical protein CB1_001745013 [Camelus ferus]|nr:hypothetical protein CB1_001745013 [Camelus ferus]